MMREVSSLECVCAHLLIPLQSLFIIFVNVLTEELGSDANLWLWMFMSACVNLDVGVDTSPFPMLSAFLWSLGFVAVDDSFFMAAIWQIVNNFMIFSKKKVNFIDLEQKYYIFL